jgi:integrase
VIFKRGKSRDYTVRTRINGTLYQFPTHQSNPDTARRLLAEFRERTALEQAGMPLPERLRPKDALCTIGTFLNALETDLRLRGKLSGRSARRMLSNLKRAKRDFGKLTPRELTAEHADDYIEARLAAGNKPASINRTTQLVRQGCKLAVKRGHLRQMPDIKHLSEKGNARQGFCDVTGLRRFCSFLPAHLADMALFGFCTGMRFGEIASLKWEHVRGDTITLLAEDAKGDGSESNARMIPMVGKDLAGILERRRAAQLATTKDTASLIFHCDGRPVQGICKLGAWKRARKSTGMRLLFHDLRRSFAKSSDEAGISRDVAMTIGGWRTQSTYSRYNIVDTRRTRQGLEQLQRFWETGSPGR